MVPSLITGNEDISEFVFSAYKIKDPIICVCETPFSVHPDETDDDLFLEHFVFFEKDQINSMFFPQGCNNSVWNFAMLSINEKALGINSFIVDKPVIGWIMSVDLNSLTIDTDFEIF